MQVDGARPERFFLHAERALGVGVVLVGAVLLFAAVVPAGPLSVDAHWSEWMRDIRGPFLDGLAHVFNALGRGLLRGLTIGAIGLVLLVRRRRLSVCAFALTESLAPLASTALKHLVDRPRPAGGLVHPNGSSFPSGHATYAGATCVALVLLFTAPGPHRRAAWALAAIATAGMAWSRTYLQVHWLSDALAGSVLGIGLALSAFAGCAIARRPSAHRPPLGKLARRHLPARVDHDEHAPPVARQDG